MRLAAGGAVAAKRISFTVRSSKAEGTTSAAAPLGRSERLIVMGPSGAAHTAARALRV